MRASGYINELFGEARIGNLDARITELQTSQLFQQRFHGQSQPGLPEPGGSAA